MTTYRVEYVDLESVKKEFLQYAPTYALEEAKEAIERVSELQSQGILRSGLYYVVLADLVGSTSFGATHGNPALRDRIEWFVRSSLRAVASTRLTNTALFLKEIGDAVLWVFQHFPDVLKWSHNFQSELLSCPRPIEPILIRTCVHLGEVYLDGVNPLSLAVSQTFKMEKEVGASELVLTEPAYSVAWPSIARAYHAFEPAGSATLPGFTSPVNLYRLCPHAPDDLLRIATEDLNR
jgi:class 3 adenylate cyclase